MSQDGSTKRLLLSGIAITCVLMLLAISKPGPIAAVPAGDVVSDESINCAHSHPFSSSACRTRTAQCLSYTNRTRQPNQSRYSVVLINSSCATSHHFSIRSVTCSALAFTPEANHWKAVPFAYSQVCCSSMALL
jgi:hypothetical protein